jgi:hypothetical protein
MFEGCDSEFTQNGNLKTHIERMHSVDGMKRQKKHENRVRTCLSEWDFVVDEEVTINVERNNCLTGTNRQFSRVDFVIISCTSCILILECDENQHYWYEVSCECGRMADVAASLRVAGYTKPVYFLRYSPNGAFQIDSVMYSRVPRTLREQHLKERILEISNSPEPEALLTVEYLFYDIREGIPVILNDPDYPVSLAAFVVSPVHGNIGTAVWA